MNVSHNGAEKAVFGRLIIGHPVPSCSHSLLCSTNDGAATILPEQWEVLPGGRKGEAQPLEIVHGNLPVQTGTLPSLNPPGGNDSNPPSLGQWDMFYIIEIVCVSLCNSFFQFARSQNVSG